MGGYRLVEEPDHVEQGPKALRNPGDTGRGEIDGRIRYLHRERLSWVLKPSAYYLYVYRHWRHYRTPDAFQEATEAQIPDPARDFALRYRH